MKSRVIKNDVLRGVIEGKDVKRIANHLELVIDNIFYRVDYGVENRHKQNLKQVVSILRLMSMNESMPCDSFVRRHIQFISICSDSLKYAIDKANKRKIKHYKKYVELLYCVLFFNEMFVNLNLS